MKQLWQNTLLPIGSLRHFVPYLRQYRLKLLLIVGFGIITSVVPLALPHLFRVMIDVAYPTHNLQLFWKISLAMVVLTLLVAAVRDYGEYLATRVNYDMRRRIQSDLFNTMNCLQMSYLERTGPNTLVERMSFDSQEIAKTLLAVTTDAISVPILFIVTILLMTRISATFTLVVLAIIPLYYGVTVVATSILRKLQHQYRCQVERVKNIIDESFHGIEVLKVFSLQKKLQQKSYENALKDIITLEMTTWRYTFIYGRLSQLMTSGWGFALTTGGLFLMFKGYLQMGEAMALGMYVVVLMRPFSELLSLYRALVTASVAAQRIIELDRYRVKPLSDSAITVPDMSKGITVQELSFSYDSEEPVLRNISLRVPSGSTLAIIGANGSGKTTLLKLIANYYTQYSGNILLGDTELRDISAESYAEHIAMVWAENHFFERTILANCLPENESSEDEIRHIAKILGFDAWISKLDSGYNSVLGVNGIKLSSGESHKIALLRALAKRPRILLIDEFSSCLDIESEQALFDGLASLRPDDSITILVTHKLDVAMHPCIRQVAVLSEGRLMEYGPLEQLIGRATIPMAHIGIDHLQVNNTIFGKHG